ncbi:energy transducer TonB [Winogradskyella sp. MIT101101]|uniref:energy transducer TonB n=1 Tax=Winogradskyella sp. MIT101101 TaxID=3098297 RepID=UPI00399C1665
MKLNYSISIPQPCHQDWYKMTPNEKGRFCQSCSKTVVDFTKMNTDEIQDYIHNNRNQRICGHIKQSQLDTINLKIPETIFNQKLSFHRVFILALLFSMGLTLFNCEDEKGKAKKIESIEIVETHQKTIDTIINNNDTKTIQLDNNLREKVKSSKSIVKEQEHIEGMMIVETGGIEVEPVEIDSLKVEPLPKCPDPEEEFIIGFINIESPPEFFNTPHHLSNKEKKDYFSEKINQIVLENFDIGQGDLDISGRQRIFTQFTINKVGKVSNIKVRAPHIVFEKEAIRVLNLLPQFKPARQRDKNVSVTYTLPITFISQD